MILDRYCRIDLIQDNNFAGRLTPLIHLSRYKLARTRVFTAAECEGRDRWWPGVTRLVTVTPETKPDLGPEELQLSVESGAAPDPPPSYTEVVTSNSKDGLPGYATICENI